MLKQALLKYKENERPNLAPLIIDHGPKGFLYYSRRIYTTHSSQDNHKMKGNSLKNDYFKINARFNYYNFIFLLIISHLSKITQTGVWNILAFISQTKANTIENIQMRFVFQACYEDVKIELNETLFPS